jgi:DNA (cytosine-5)-methyltransferase 1
MLNKFGFVPALVDLFCGCGGLSWGFKEAGFPIRGCVDLSAAAIASIKANFVSPANRPAVIRAANICDLDPADFMAESDSGCIVIGGPPCQAYSRIGRGKLRSLGEHRAHLKDARGKLYEEFILFATALDARAIVMENVLDSISYGGENIPDLICGDLEQMGYIAGWSVLNAADFGVPQVRERVILIAIRDGEGFRPEWPVPTHCQPPDLRLFPGLNFTEVKARSTYFVPTRQPLEGDSKPWVTVGDALSDLPKLRGGAGERYVQNRVNQELPYRSEEPANEFQFFMRRRTKEWGATTGHVYRNTPRDWPIFERMAPGNNYLDAARIADCLLEEACSRLGIFPDKAPDAYRKLKQQIVPPYDRRQFDDKWKRLDPRRPSHTVVAHLGVDTYSHIHPFEPRGISIREAARLQSFPDDYLFWGSMGDSYKQIGNAVPPLLSHAVATVLYKKFSATGHGFPTSGSRPI